MKTVIEPGASIDTLTKGELSEELAAQTQAAYRQLARSVKYLRLTPQSTAVKNSAFVLDGTTLSTGPREGFVWTVRRLGVAGLTAGPTPDVANLYRNGTTGLPAWQFNGNNFIYTFGKGEMLLLPGETLSLVSLGTIAATGQVTLFGDAVECAAEEIFKIL